VTTIMISIYITYASHLCMRCLSTSALLSSSSSSFFFGDWVDTSDEMSTRRVAYFTLNSVLTKDIGLASILPLLFAGGSAGKDRSRKGSRSSGVRPPTRTGEREIHGSGPASLQNYNKLKHQVYCTLQSVSPSVIKENQHEIDQDMSQIDDGTGHVQ